MAKPKRRTRSPEPKRSPVLPRLPDPKLPGPYRPFESDPGWAQSWYWLWVTVAHAAFVIASCAIDPNFYRDWIIPEGYGFLEFTQFVVMVAAFGLAVRLLFDPFVRGRPFVLTVTIFAALSSLYIAGEEMSWGQHFFHWNTPEYWARLNIDDETNLHKSFDLADKLPRVTLELGVLIGGLLIPLAALFKPWLRACRASLFLPAAALVPTAGFVVFFKVVDKLHSKNYVHPFQRPSESVESYLFYFILLYLIVFTHRIREIEIAERSAAAKT